MKSAARLLLPLVVAGAMLGATTATASADYTVSFIGVPQTILLFEGTADTDKATVRSHGPGTNLLDIDEGSDGDVDFEVATTLFDRIQVFGREGDDSITFDDSRGPVTGDDPAEIAGGRGNDTIVGGDGADDISAGPGDDTIDGGRGADAVRGGTEDDTIRWSPGGGNDTVSGEQGSDTFELTGSAAPENVTVEPVGAVARVRRDVGVLTADLTGIELLDVDLLDGNDTFTVFPGVTSPLVTVDGGNGTDRLAGTAAADELRGGPGDDELTGEAGADALFGGDGADALAGGAGADSFHCGGFGDTFDLTAEDTLDADCRATVPPAAPAEPEPAEQTRAAAPQPAPQPQPAAAVSCVVPKLKKLTLAKAKKRLKKAHCQLGKVRKPHGRGRGRLVVRKQSVKPGAVRKANAKVSVSLVRGR